MFSDTYVTKLKKNFEHYNFFAFKFIKNRQNLTVGCFAIPNFTLI